MRACLRVAALLVAAVSVLGSIDQPYLCAKNGTYDCECLDGVPYLVDCNQFDMQEFPMTKPEEFPFEWVAYLGGNRISHIPAIPAQDKLIMLSFSENHISTIADSAFASLPALRKLDISHCRLNKTSLTVDAFRGPFDKKNGHDPLLIHTLDLSHNQIESLDGHAFNHLLELKALYISDNPFGDFSPETSDAFSELTALVKLDLSRTQLRRIPDHFLAGMRHLKELVLEGNMFVTVPQDVNFARSLQILNLDNNPIKVISPTKNSAFHSSTSLTHLSLSYMPDLNTVDNEAFSGLTNLTVLSLHHNPKLQHIRQLAFIGTTELDNNLKEVYLNDNQLKTLAEDLLPWKQLTAVDLQHNPWSCDCRIKWFTEGPLQQMMKQEPERARYIVCASPSKVSGQNVKYLVSHEYTFPCPDPQYPPTNPDYYGTFIVATIFMGAFLLLSATILFAYALYHRTKGSTSTGQTIHYRRAREADLEVIAQSAYS